MAVAVEPLRPSVGFCLQVDGSATGLSGRWFINMVKHKLVDLPVAYSGAKVSKDWILANGIGNMQVPLDMGSFRKLKERAEGSRKTTYCVDAVFCPLIIKMFMDDDFCNKMATFRPFVIKLALDRIEESIGIKLLQQNVKLAKNIRYKDPEDEAGTVAKEFTSLSDDMPELEVDEPAPEKIVELKTELKGESTKPDDGCPLIQEVGANRKPKPAMKKGFLNTPSSKTLYGANGSGEGVLPENAGDPMGWMPKGLRNKSKIVDCNSPEYQQHEKNKKANAESNEFRDLLKADGDSWQKRNHGKQWQEDLPEGTEPASKYDVNYSRFDSIDDVEESSSVPERDYYFDTDGTRQPLSKKRDDGSVRPGSNPAVKKGFFDNQKSPIYPKGSEQAKDPMNDEAMYKGLYDLLESSKNAQPPRHDKDSDLPDGTDAVTSRPTAPTPPSTGTSTSGPASTPEYDLKIEFASLLLTVNVPLLDSMQGVDLDVTDRTATLAFPKGSNLKPLTVALPEAVDATNVRARFSKKKKHIQITMPKA
jgi:hypothetical protein